MWSKLLHSLVGRSGAPRWKRAAKCLSLIKHLQGRITIQKKRKQSIISHSRADIEQLLHNGQIQEALHRVGQLHKDQKRLCAYNQIEHFSQHVLANFCHVKFSSWGSLPNDIREAVLGLVFAASRCGELPELNLIRILFREHFGPEFELANCVNLEMKQNLCINFVPDDVKLNMIDEIAKEYNIDMGFQDSEHKAEVLDLEIHGIAGATDDESCMDITELPIIPTWKDFLDSPTRPLSTSTSLDGISDLMYETSIVYLDDLEEKESTSGDQNSLDISTISTKHAIEYCSKSTFPETQHYPSSTEDLLKRNDCRELNSWRGSMETRPKHVHPKLPDYDDVVAQLKDIKCSMLVNDHASWDGSMAMIEALKQNSTSPPTHVHLELPDYDNMVAMLKDIKAEQRQRLLLLRC